MDYEMCWNTLENHYKKQLKGLKVGNKKRSEIINFLGLMTDIESAVDKGTVKP